jgi:hypothetical protein
MFYRAIVYLNNPVYQIILSDKHKDYLIAKLINVIKAKKDKYLKFEIFKENERDTKLEDKLRKQFNDF